MAKGALPGDLVAAGLLIAPEDGGAPYDRFRDRIIFPIADGRGRVISFGGRAMDPAARAKYLNGPDSELFDKGRVLYGLAEARKLLHANSTSGAATARPWSWSRAIWTSSPVSAPAWRRWRRWARR